MVDDWLFGLPSGKRQDLPFMIFPAINLHYFEKKTGKILTLKNDHKIHDANSLGWYQ
jgi:hypothetical protein